MRADELLAEAASRAGLTSHEISAAAHALHGVIREAVRAGHSVALPGFGRFDALGMVWYGDCSLLPLCEVQDEREGWGEEVDAVAAYLRDNYDPEGFFGIGFDTMPASSLSPAAFESDIRAEQSRLHAQPNIAHIVAEILS